MAKEIKDNVIDMTERMQEPAAKERVQHLKVRFDLERAKVGLSASLLSIVLLVTLANNNLMSKIRSEPQLENQGGRAIASIPTGTSDAEDSLVHQLANHDLSQAASVGHRPSAIEKLAFGTLEGHYSIRLLNGKLSEIELSNDQSAKQIDDLEHFIENNRDVLPVAFDKPVKVKSEDNGGIVTETWQLINTVSRPVAHVQFRLDAAGHMLAMHVALLQIASK